MNNLKVFLFIVLTLLVSMQIISASDYKIELTMVDKTFKANEDITFKISIYDKNNKIIQDNVKIIIEDLEKTKKIEKNINTKDIISLDLGENSKQGQWEINIIYQDAQAKDVFFIEAKQELKFEIIKDKLIIKNTGNIKAKEKIRIQIGDTIGDAKPLELDIGEQEEYRLIAPEGSYSIKVLSEDEVLFRQSEVQLEGSGLTGNVIGAIDEDVSERNPFTGGVSPEGNSDDTILSYTRNNKAVYVFILVVFGATIFLALEKKYFNKKLEQ